MRLVLIGKGNSFSNFAGQSMSNGPDPLWRLLGMRELKDCPADPAPQYPA